LHLEEMFKLVDRWENQHSLVPTARQVRPFLQQFAAIAPSSSDPMLGRKILRLLDQVEMLDSSLESLQRGLRRQSSLVKPNPPRLQIQALGRAEAQLQQSATETDGRKSSAQPFTSVDWQTLPTRDLFFLILSDPRGWSKEALGELLWPGSTPAQLKLRFKNTIYRLRRVLQQDAILFEDDRYSFNQALDYEYDVERFLEQLKLAAESGSPKKKIKALQSAMQLYQGDYLPEVGGAWVLPERERLRQAFLEAGIRLSRLFLEGGQAQQAQEIAARVIAADACLEEAYIVAMQAQAAAGNHPAIARLYEKLSQALSQELGACPSPQTESLYQSLKD
jgi:DNA-binding SARP family transcriptional activator